MKTMFVFNCFNNWRVAESQMKAFFEQTDLEGLAPYTITLVYCHYPLPSKEENLSQFERIAREAGAHLMVLERNFGQSRNFNVIREELKKLYSPEPCDMLAFWEPDCAVNTRGWAKACAAILKEDSSPLPPVGFLSPHRMPAWVLGNQGREHVVAGHRVRELCWPGGFPMGIYSWGFVEDMGQLEACRSFYGGTELDIISTLNRCNRRGVMFCDIEDFGTNAHFDAAYIAWKQHTIHLPSHEQLDFEAWLSLTGAQ